MYSNGSLHDCHSTFHKLNTDYVPEAVLGSGNMVANKEKKNSYSAAETHNKQ